MVDMVRMALSENGHSELAALVVLGNNGRPLCAWPNLGRAVRTDDVRLVHAAMLRAYEAYAPEESVMGRTSSSHAHWVVRGDRIDG